MNIIRIIASFFIISFITIINVSIASNSEQGIYNSRTQNNYLFDQNYETKTIDKLENLNFKREDESLLSRVIDLPALWAVIGSVLTGIVTGIVNYYLERKRQIHAEKMQTDKNKFEYEKEYKKNMNNLYAEYASLCGSFDFVVDESKVAFDIQTKKALIGILFQIYAMSDDENIKVLAYKAIQDFMKNNNNFDNLGKLSKSIFSLPKK